MASTATKTGGKRVKKEMDFCGLDPAMMTVCKHILQHLWRKLIHSAAINEQKADDWKGRSPGYYKVMVHSLNIRHGRVLIFEYRYMEEHPDEMNEFMAEYSKSEASKPKLDLSKYNYNALTASIAPDSFWVVQLEHMRYVDKSGNTDPDKVNSTVGAKPVFTIYCYDEKGHYRIMDKLQIFQTPKLYSSEHYQWFIA